MTTAISSPRPWYRQFWPWLVFSLPALAVVGSLVSFWLAAHSADAMVVDDYYKQGRAINQSLARVKMAETLQLQAELQFPEDAKDKQISLHLHSAQSLQLPEQLTLRLIHPTQAARDQTLRFIQRGDGDYHAELTESLGTTRWQLQLEDARHTWHLRQATSIVPGQKIALIP
jgi:hypothetical protein